MKIFFSGLFAEIVFSSIKLIRLIKRKAGAAAMFFRRLQLTSGDHAYKRQFEKRYIPYLYKRHVEENYENCAFCTCLVKAACHKYCLKCSKGAYIESSPLLPGILSCEAKEMPGVTSVTAPWYFRSPCTNFERLPMNQYLKNFKVFMSSITIYNYEVLEGLLEGMSSCEKPCFVCASTDYEIYKKCSMQGDFDKNTPCSRIYLEIASRYVS